MRSSELFFYELIAKSKKRNNINTNEFVDVYLVKLLDSIALGENRFITKDSLSLLYLQAYQTNNHKEFRIVGDSCLLLLGFFPSQSIESFRTLYRSIGISSYDFLQEQIYRILASEFDGAVHLLLGAHAMLQGDNVTSLFAWNTKI